MNRQSGNAVPHQKPYIANEGQHRIPVRTHLLAYRTVAAILLIHVFCAVLLSQGPDARTSTGVSAAHQDHGPGEPTSSTPASLPSSPQIQPQPIPNAPSQTGNIIGTVTDIKNNIVPGATVVLEGSGDPRTVVANDRGFFEFNVLESGTYHLTASAKGFAKWISPAIILNPGQAVILTGCRLKVAEARTTVIVSSEQIAAEQVKIQEKQRVFGIIPNFYVVYNPNAEPLPAKLKFKLALRTSIDPVTFLGVGIFAGVNQALDRPHYVQGAKGYAERYGTTAADGFIDIMIGGAILPSLLHQDPRYFYQGTGTKLSRTLHALSHPFVCKGDNGHLQPNYSSMGGDLATTAISTAYYPASDRGPRTVFESFLINTSERVASSLAQEFIVRRLTPKAKKQHSSATE